jgi:intracellular septation protein A
MTEINRSTAPTTKIEEMANTAERSDYGLKLSISLFWRVILLHNALRLPISIIIAFADIGDNYTLLKLIPSLFFAVVSVSLACSLQVSSHGFIFLFFGSRLHMTLNNWRRVTWLFCGLYFLLCVANIIVGFTAPFDIWIQYKTFAPAAAIITLCLVAPRILARTLK